MLFLFNMMPAPPLDGAHVLANFHRGYARLIGDPGKQGAHIFMFIGAFVVITTLIEPLAARYGAFVKWIAVAGQ